MFRVLSVVAIGYRVYPRQQPRKRAACALLVPLAAALLAAGCGGDGSDSTQGVETQQVRAVGVRFSAPAGWQVTTAARGVTVRPSIGPALASVTVLVLRRRYRPALFAETARELDRVTGALAAKLGGRVIESRSVVVGGIRSRQYDVAYSRDGTGLIDRITYVLRGRSEYYLLCRWAADEGESRACALLTVSFRIR
jgi:hypothetical protein